ncbi:MAG: helix-turn-helix domain-containing protein [Candidatus Thermoplasmatota archaeon]
MKKFELTEKEKLTLYGLVKYPNLTDKKLAENINLKHSTVTSIRHRLKEKQYFRNVNIPRLQKLGSEMLVVIYTNFSPLIPLKERIQITGRTIEVFEEIFFSVGEQDKGFSLSFTKDYTNVGKINDIRTKTFGSRGLLEEEYPNMVLFPFDISKIYRFFDYAPLLNSSFELNIDIDEESKNVGFMNRKKSSLTDTEKDVYYMLIRHPDMSDKDIGYELGVSRHTVSRLKKKFMQNNLIRKIRLPNIKNLGYDILTFYHIRFDPRNPPDMEQDESALLISDSTIFMASRMFEAVMISIYRNYDDYKKDKNRIMQILKENKWIADDPLILSYSVNTLAFIKDFKFAPITKKITDCNLLL